MNLIMIKLSILILVTGIDVDAFAGIFKPYFNDGYSIVLALLGPAVILGIAATGFQYVTKTDKDDRSWTEFGKKCLWIIIVAVIIVAAPVIIEAFGI